MKTLDQKLLKWAHDRVQDAINSDRLLEESNRGKKKKYRTAVRGAPAFIQGCGLAQAIAFWQAGAAEKGKGKVSDDAYGYKTLLSHLSSEAIALKDLCSRARSADIGEYVFLTTRTQAALVFLKRMTDAYLPADKDED